MDIGFYHCTRAPAVSVAVRLAAKALASGKRLLLVADADRLDAVDRALWVDAPDSFLAHGRAGGPDEAQQPILLADAAGPAANGATLLMLVEAGVPAALDGYERVLNLFEDGSPAHARARADWKALSARDGLTRSYWQQTEGGGWDRKA